LVGQHFLKAIFRNIIWSPWPARKSDRFLAMASEKLDSQLLGRSPESSTKDFTLKLLHSEQGDQDALAKRWHKM
jgi:hypothetical protein